MHGGEFHELVGKMLAHGYTLDLVIVEAGARSVYGGISRIWPRLNLGVFVLIGRLHGHTKLSERPSCTLPSPFLVEAS